jgi:16S rRNA (guanine(966)-N(2))-methyltransferase RsmD
MRVITGFAKGKRLKAPEGLDTRPTSDRVKEGMFSAIQFDIESASVLDLYSGSGQLGIEALSRGAENACFVDKSSSAINIIKDNIKNTGFESKSKVVNSDCFDFLKSTSQSFDIAFLDPPYNNDLIMKTLPLLEKKMNPNGLAVCEHELRLDLPEKIGKFTLKKNYAYGKIKISIFTVEE